MSRTSKCHAPSAQQGSFSRDWNPKQCASVPIRPGEETTVLLRSGAGFREFATFICALFLDGLFDRWGVAVAVQVVRSSLECLE